MATVRDLITDSLEDIGIIAAGETPSAADLESSLKVLNRMIDSWSTENLALYELPREVFELVPGQSIYAFDPDGDFQTSRPMSFLGAAYGALIKTPIYETPEPTEEVPDPEPVLVGYDLKVDYEFPVEIVDYQTWISIPDKTRTSGVVTYVYPFGSAPFEKVQVYPEPESQLGLVLYSKKILAQFEDADTELSLPPGYWQALVDNLALKLCRKFGKPVTADLDRDATSSKAAIKRQNTRIPRMESEARFISTSNCRRGNIFGGGYN